MINESEFLENLKRLKSQNLFRTLTHRNGIDFCSNDYLGLARNSESIKAGMEAVEKFGTGSTGSRLLSGNKSIFEDFEEQIAVDKRSESALIFNSGYIANLSIISAFASLDYLIIFDKLNHASMYQGLGNARLQRFNHLNYNQLEQILEKYKNYPKKFIASETVFGMDGDIADLQRLSALAHKYGAFLYLDEAHATGLYGKRGYGFSMNFNLDKDSVIVMGTFSKALASCGAYVACSKILKDYLIQVSKGFIYSTAISPFCIGVAQYNWRKLPDFDGIRVEILKKSDYFRQELKKRGTKFIGKNTNIVAITFGDTEEMLAVHERLLKKNIITSAIRRPTSPTPRIRLAFNATHSYEDINLLLDVL